MKSASKYIYFTIDTRHMQLSYIYKIHNDNVRGDVLYPPPPGCYWIVSSWCALAYIRASRQSTAEMLNAINNLFRQTIDTGDAEQTQRLLFDINLIFSMHSSPSVQSAIMFLLVKASQTALFKASNVRHLKGAQSYRLFILKSANKYCLTHARFP